MAAVTIEIVRTEEAMKRYHLAFEGGTMAHEDCGSRFQELGVQLRELRCREEELVQASSQDGSDPFDDSYVADIRDALREAIEGGTPQHKKALLMALLRRSGSRETKRRRSIGFRAPGCEGPGFAWR